MTSILKLTLGLSLMLVLKARSDGGWNISGKGSRISASSSSDIVLFINSGEQVSKVKWGGNLKQFENFSLNFRLRHGSMYSLLSVNELIDIMELNTLEKNSKVEGDTFTAGYRSSGREVEVSTEYLMNEKEGSLKIKLSVRNTSDKTMRCQLQLEPAVTAEKVPDVALRIPVPCRFETLRAMDPSGQVIKDQDSHGRVERTFRLSSPFILLVSPPDRQSVLIEGSNIQFVKSWRQWKNTGRFSIHGRVFVLEPGQQHSETYSFRMVDGLGFDTLSPAENLKGYGAMLENLYITGGDKVKALFSSPSDTSVSAGIFSGEKQVVVCRGTGDMDIDISGLPDGEYRALLSLKNEKGEEYKSEEKLTLWRQKYTDIERQVKELSSFVSSSNPSGFTDSAAAEHRLNLLKWKLEEVEAYKAVHEVQQVEGLLKDAWNIKKVLDQDVPAICPQPAGIIYENNFAQDTDDFIFYGTAELAFDKDNGMTVKPSGTTNLWSRFKLEGSYMVELDFFAPSGYRGGTFVQFNGDSFNPVREDRLMASASWGSMEHYIFNTLTYHFSFSAFTPAVKARNEARFRKTGPGFYILSKAPDPVMTDKWHRLSFVKKGNQFLFFADGKLVLEYFDIGAQGPVLESGRLGFRVWGGSCASFRNLRICRIE